MLNSQFDYRLAGGCDGVGSGTVDTRSGIPSLANFIIRSTSLEVPYLVPRPDPDEPSLPKP